jgi:Zn-dependent protease
MKRDYYYPIIVILIGLNSFLYPITIGPSNVNLKEAFSQSLVTFLISYTLIGIIVGGGIAALSKDKSKPLRERTKEKALKVILVIQLLFLTAELGELILSVFKLNV